MSRARWTASYAFGALACAGCAEPTFVSLGRNLSAVQGEEDAGAAAPFYVPGDAASFDDPAADDGPPASCAGTGRNLLLTPECGARVPTPCRERSAQIPDPLDATLSFVLGVCGASSVVIAVRFEQGCATSYELSSPVDRLVSACIEQRLGNERYDCAERVTCGTGRNFPQLTN